ncbi:MAG: hypothetical protein ACREA0_22315 [bacterium]
MLKRSRSVVLALDALELDALEIVQAPMLFGGLVDSCGKPGLGFARSIAAMRAWGQQTAPRRRTLRDLCPFLIQLYPVFRNTDRALGVRFLSVRGQMARKADVVIVGGGIVGSPSLPSCGYLPDLDYPVSLTSPANRAPTS